jgi:hypothetical protein
MAYAPTRSCRKELWYGINDGVYKDGNINWANVSSNETVEVRAQMDRIWHGFNEAPVKYIPDGRSYTTKGAKEIGSNERDYY